MPLTAHAHTRKHTSMAYSVGNPNWMAVLADDGCLERRLEEMVSKLYAGEG